MAEQCYLHLPAGAPLPALSSARPLRVAVVVEQDCPNDWRNAVCDWLFKAGCRYLVAWGKDCSGWDDAMDWTCLEACKFSASMGPDFVMTTWHDDEPLFEALAFAKHAANHPVLSLPDFCLLHIAPAPRKNELLQIYDAA
ncbi:DUF7684 family protein [Inhella proteolytica]|uniref:DUF7684 domain-containing protein n=1 Tax=Inhella proteolytica TaxID=2795029 RepID=A0A931J533_9BURK|nr:hypothetical protein [Inhella proteolytica]MBH9577694.1 hypothetical protein [Inhella proteolytica]